MTNNKKTYCRICEPACALVAQVNEDVIKLVPDRDHPIHQGFCCHKGLTFDEIHQDPDRLDYPMRRVNRGSDEEANFERTTWDAAMDDIGEKLRGILDTYGPDAIATYHGNPLAFDSRAFIANAGFSLKLGTTKLFNGATQDCSNKIVAGEYVYGTGSMHPIPDLHNTDYFLCIGSNPRVSHMSFFHSSDPMGQIEEIKKRGGKVRYVNPRIIESASKTGNDVLLIKPDTDVYFLAAVINEIYVQGAFDTNALEAHGKNIDGLISFVTQYSADRVANVTGLSAIQIREVAHDFVSAKAASITMSTGANMGRQGTLAYWLVQMLSLVTGNLGKRGGNVYSPGYFAQAFLGAMGDKNPYFDSALGPMRHACGALPGNLFSQFLESEKSPTKALIVFSGNPLLSMSAEESISEKLKDLELIVCIDIYRTATGEYADYLLPAADWLERADVNIVGAGYQPDPFLQYTDAIVPPKAERKEDWWIYARLEQAMGLPSLLDAEEPDSWAQVNEMLAVSDLSVDKLRERGVVTLPSPTGSEVFEIGIQHADKKVDCCPAAFKQAIERSEQLFNELDLESDDIFKLITRRTIYMHNGWLQNQASLKRPAHKTNPLYMNPTDADAKGLQDGDSVHISNEYGELVAEIRCDESLRRGVVAMTHGWGNKKSAGMKVAQKYPGVNVNRLLPTGFGSFEPLSNMSFMTGVPVEIRLAP